MKRITDQPMICPKCGTTAKAGECEPDVDGDGSLGCPNCNTVMRLATPTIEQVTDAMKEGNT